MTSDEDKDSIQQSLPLSWEESQAAEEEQPAQKKLLLKRSEETTGEEDNVSEDFEESAEQNTDPNVEAEEEMESSGENDTPDTVSEEGTSDEEKPVEQIRVAKPLLLRKAAEPEENENEVTDKNKETVVDERFYDNAQINVDDFSDYDEDAHLDGVKSEHEPDKEVKDTLLLKKGGPKEEEAESNNSTEDDSQVTADTEDNSDEEDEIDDAEEDSLNDSYLGQEKDFDLDEDSEDPSFNDSGTFSLDEDYEDNDRLSISEGVLGDLDEEESSSEKTEVSPLKIIKETQDPSPEDEDNSDKSVAEEMEKKAEENKESIFALKADTYYDQDGTEVGDTAETMIKTPEDAEFFSHEEKKSLGEMLQESRLACSFTIKDASEATRIKSSYIISLEADDLEDLPPRVYILNYIRQLCREYNIPHAPLVQQYEQQADNKGGGEVKVVRVEDEDAKKATKPHSKFNTIIVASALIVFGVLIFTAWSMQWFGPANSAEALKNVEINLIEMRSSVKLPSPELPVPSR